MTSWNKEYRPEQITSRLEKGKILSETDSISFEGFLVSECAVILISMLSINKEIPDTEKKRIISKSIFNSGKSGEITPNSLIKEIKKLEGAYLRKPFKKHCIVAEISISRFHSLPKINFNGCRLIFSPSLNKNFFKPRNQIIEQATKSMAEPMPKFYSIVKVHVSGRTISDAVQTALNNLDFIRGIWNLYLNRSQTIRMSSGQRKPVNRIVLGPIHSLHLPTGPLSSDTWWYEPQYRGPITPFNENKKYGGMNRFLVNVRKHLKKHNYSSDIEFSVIRYVRALDSRDWEDSFLKLWGVLELLTDTIYDGYKVTVKRSSFLYEDREYAQQVLSHLKDYRNKAVHAGSESNDIENLMYQLKNIIETLIEFHLSHGNKFESLADAASVMDLPTNKEKLNKKSKNIKFAKQYLKH